MRIDHLPTGHILNFPAKRDRERERERGRKQRDSRSIPAVGLIINYPDQREILVIKKIVIIINSESILCLTHTPCATNKQ